MLETWTVEQIQAGIILGLDRARLAGSHPKYLVYFRGPIQDAVAAEGYRLIYWDEWGPLPEWWNKKEGIKLRYRVLKKLEASNSKLRHLEKALNEEDENVFFRKLYEK